MKAKTKLFATTTKLAVHARTTTTEMAKRLKRAGIEPVRTIVTKERTFREWGADALRFVKAYRAERDAQFAAPPTVAPAVAAEPQVEPPTQSEVLSDAHRVKALADTLGHALMAMTQLRNEMQRMRSEVSDLVGAVTRLSDLWCVDAAQQINGPLATTDD